MSLFVRGIPQTKAALEKAKLEIEAAAPTATKAGAETVGHLMAATAPRNTGATASSITVDTESSGDGSTSHVGPTTPYARFTEFGTTYIPAEHWASRAAEGGIPAIIAGAIGIFKTALR